jgi:hypothetical protein
MWVRIQLLILMRSQIRILLLIKVMDFEPPGLNCERPRPSAVLFGASKDSERIWVQLPKIMRIRIRNLAYSNVVCVKVEVYKKQVVELNAKLSGEAERADRIAFDNAKLMEKLEALSVERDRLAIERDALRETNEEMKILQEVSSNQGVGGSKSSFMGVVGYGSVYPMF